MPEIVKRKIDELGRIMLPIEVRKEIDIDLKDELAIHVKNGEIVIKKLQPSCMMCKKTSNLTMLNNKSLCIKCINKIKGMN